MGEREQLELRLQMAQGSGCAAPESCAANSALPSSRVLGHGDDPMDLPCFGTQTTQGSLDVSCRGSSLKSLGGGDIAAGEHLRGSSAGGDCDFTALKQNIRAAMEALGRIERQELSELDPAGLKASSAERAMPGTGAGMLGCQPVQEA